MLVLCYSFNSFAQETKYSLEKCIKIALENNLTVQRSLLDQELTGVNKNQSIMERLPNFNMGAGYGTNWGRSIDPTSNQFITQKNNSANISGSSSLTIFNGLQISNTIKQNELNWQAGNLDLSKAKNDLSLNVATLYLNVIFNQELVGNAQFQLNSTNEQMSRTRKLVDAGALPRTNLLDLQSQAASNEVNLINAENNYSFALLNLKQALLIPARDVFEIEVPDLDPESIDVAALDPEFIYKTAEATMPEVQSADLRIHVANLNYKISRGAYAPNLSVSYSFRSNYSSVVADQVQQITDDTFTPTPIGYLASDPTELVFRDFATVVGEEPGFGVGEQFKENISRNLSLNLTIPLFNRFQTKAGVQRAVINKKRAEITSREVRNQLRQTIETSYNDLVAASKSHTANQHQVAALGESFRVTENQFNIGAVHFVDYQVANNNLFIARSDLVRAKYDLIFKKKVLDFYLGKPITL